MGEWYEEISCSDEISQGDIIFNCDVISPIYDSENSEGGYIEASLFNLDVIVMTQSCDLANKKVDNVLLARVCNVEELLTKAGSIKERIAIISDVNKGRYPRYHLLNQENEGSVKLDFKYIDFATVFTMPINYVTSRKELYGTRLRLKSPYKEYISQRFGNYYSRIGLPLGIKEEDIKSFIKNKY